MQDYDCQASATPALRLSGSAKIYNVELHSRKHETRAEASGGPFRGTSGSARWTARFFIGWFRPGAETSPPLGPRRLRDSSIKGPREFMLLRLKPPPA